MSANDVLITAVEAARRLSMSQRTIYRLLTSGELPSVKIRRARRIRVADLERFAARAASTPPDQVKVTGASAGKSR